MTAATERDLMRRLGELGIPATTRRHEPLFTVEDGRHLHEGLPGGHCKSLFLKDKKGALWLVVALHDTRVDLKGLQKALGAARFSFAKPDLLMEVLGVTPGAVTPFALINAEGGARDATLSVVLDARMLAEDIVNYHPLTNDATTAISPGDLLRFIREMGYEPAILDIGALGGWPAGGRPIPDPHGQSGPNPV